MWDNSNSWLFNTLHFFVYVFDEVHCHDEPTWILPGFLVFFTHNKLSKLDQHLTLLLFSRSQHFSWNERYHIWYSTDANALELRVLKMAPGDNGVAKSTMKVVYLVYVSHYWCSCEPLFLANESFKWWKKGHKNCWLFNMVSLGSKF